MPTASAAGKWETGTRDVIADAPSVHVPALENIEVAVFVIPTDAPEADGTLAWSGTTVVLVTATAAGEQGIGWTYGAGAAGAVVTDMLAPALLGHSAFDVAGANEVMARAVRGGLPAAGPDPLRGDHRVRAGRRARRRAQHPGIRALRAHAARTCRRRDAEPAARRVFP